MVPPVTAIGSDALRTIDRFVRAGGICVWIDRFPRFAFPEAADEPERTPFHWFGCVHPKDGAEVSIDHATLIYFKGASKKTAKRVAAYLDQHFDHALSLAKRFDNVRVNHRRKGALDLFLLFNDSESEARGEVAFSGDSTPVIIDMDTGAASSERRSKSGFQLSMKPYQSLCLLVSEKLHAGRLQLSARRSVHIEGKRVPLTGGWTMQIAGDALENIWRPTLGTTEVTLPRFCVKKRNFARIKGWTEPGFDDSSWEEIHAVRSAALFTDPASILFRAVLPPDARALRMSLPITGEYALWINGKLVRKNIGLEPVALSELPLEKYLVPDRNVLALETISHAGPAGLSAPLACVCSPVELETLMSWQQLDFGFYAGRVLYKKRIKVTDPFSHAELDLGKVEHTVEVFVNGSLAGTCLWPPYTIDVTSHLRRGDNEITCVDANTLANCFAWDVWGTRGTGKPDPSGLLDPVSLVLEP